MGAAIIAGILAVVGGLISYASSERTNQESLSRQLQNQDWQEQMMDKQNEYNSPSAQMQRLSEAGINPSVSFMQGANVANTSAGVNSSPLAPIVDPATLLGNLNLGSAYESIQQ